uniref:Uncharacterized protein n=2 Tax=Catarrhini TaxID=9526 RepID=A0A2R8ZK26_PANPA
MSNITRNNFFFQKHLNNQLRCCPVPFYSHPSLLSRPHAPPPQCSVLYACALCSCILNKSEINVFDAEPYFLGTSPLSLSLSPLSLSLSHCLSLTLATGTSRHCGRG